MPILALDDRDPSIIYSAGWQEAGSAQEYNSTTTWTILAGSTAKVTFSGSSIGVYGTITAGGRASIAPQTSYSIDGGTPVRFAADQTARIQYSKLFFQSPVLPDGQHTLTITNLILSDPYFLDFMLAVVPSGSNAPSSSSSSSSTPSTSSVSTPPAAPVTVTITASPTSSVNTDALGAVATASGRPVASTSKSGGNGAAIAGGVIGAIVILFIGVFGYIFWRKKHNKARDDATYSAWSDPPSSLAPPLNASGPRPPQSMAQSDAAFASYPAAGGYETQEYMHTGGSYPSAPNNYQFSPGVGSSPYSYDGQAQPYPSRAYIPPSQLAANPIPTAGPYYAAENQQGPRTRIRLD